MSFTQKRLTANISLANGNFGGGGNSISLSGLRMSAVIDVAGGVSSGTMELAIYGLPLQTMNQLSTVGTQLDQQNKNTISLHAGDENNQPGELAFSGKIFNAYVDAQNMPQVCFRIVGMPGGGIDAVKPVDPISKSGTQDVAQLMSGIAGQMGLQFENNGVNVKLRNPYYSGSAWTQATRLARHANIEMVVEKGTLAITPAGQPRQGGAILLSPQTGMVGYPAFRQAAVIVRTIFNPDIKVNGQCTVQSDLTPANGTWFVYHYIAELDCLMPHGRWFQIVEMTKTSGGSGVS